MGGGWGGRPGTQGGFGSDHLLLPSLDGGDNGGLCFAILLSRSVSCFDMSKQAVLQWSTLAWRDSIVGGDGGSVGRGLVGCWVSSGCPGSTSTLIFDPAPARSWLVPAS